MPEKSNKYLIAALLIGLVFHGSILFFTLENTYDALIHQFFAGHYAQHWFESWSYKWYTGFTVMGYPPLVHQIIALFSLIGGLKFGLFAVGYISIVLFITGVFRFSLVITGSRTIAGYGAIVASLSSFFVETLHIFGQLPSIVGISILMHALPEIYLWIKKGKLIYLVRSISLIAVTVTSHHVTPIFGMVFFIFPLIGMVIMDVSRERVNSMKEVTLRIFIQSFFKLLKRIIVFGGFALVVIVVCIFPYWVNSKANPITQVPIPHGSRDNFLEVTSSGLVFFLIPWGILLLFLPYIFYRYYSKRYLFFGLSISLLTLLGSGGTTPLPRKLLGDTAFNILTLDRFTLWASIMSLPMFGEFAYRFVEGDLKVALQQRFGAIYHRMLGGFIAALFLFTCAFTVSLGYFRPMQPQKIDMLPITNFLSQDQHDHWRYLTLGFGDQMAWLSAQTSALTVDGNYHSARRLPELTTRAVERLENSKFRGVEGIGSLQQFLTVPDKFNLKYIFANDKFYDPLLYFCGWQRLQTLENGIMVWEKLNVPPLSKILPKEDVPVVLKLMWGIIPILTVILAFIFNVQMIWHQALKIKIKHHHPDFQNFKLPYQRFSIRLITINHIWAFFIFGCILYGTYLLYIQNTAQISVKNVVKSYYDALDFKEFKRAHSYIDPASGKTMAQYMLEVSVSDGILSSYAKLNAIEVNVVQQNDTAAKVEAVTHWVTPLENVKKVNHHEIIKKQGKWFIKPSTLDTDIPPNQLFSDNITDFYNHGRRRITTQQTYHEDVLKQPVLEILSASLVKKGSRYAIVGEVQNVDHVPADVVLKATLYDAQNNELATYNAKDVIKHKLMPKEISSFRIDFEAIAWLKQGESVPETFDPEQFTPVEFEEKPVNFDLQCAGNVATTDLYKKVALSDLEISENHLTGTLFNYGTQEVTIPQLLVSYFDETKQLRWVDKMYLADGIRVQRKQFFNYSIQDIEEIEIIRSSLENCYVNGLPNKSIAEKIIPNRNWEQHQKDFQVIPGDETRFVNIQINNYIGNLF
ncbi:hypothetical protein [uncultured Sunxiuqinia sp.]|uniref:hypothetical protein n=1 Tax=uncultured Sunxiuqinia sp. TaxID=1573825 RepID=UPI002AA86B93|nr:hypothetical protein [uncultured Sunxiuqinia sp.]